MLALAGLPALAQDRPTDTPVVTPSTPGVPQLPYTVAPGGPVSASPVHGVLPGQDPFEWRPRPPILDGRNAGHVELRLKVPPGFTVYRDQLVVQVVDPGQLEVGEPDIPPGVHRHDPAYDVQVREQYDSDIVVRIPVQTHAHAEGGLESLQVFVRHQGCYQGHCFRPVERVMQVHVPVRPDAPAGAPGGASEEASPEGTPDEPPSSHSAPADPLPLPRFVVYVRAPVHSW